MRKLWDSVDLHIVLILVLACPVVFLSSWWLALPLFAPQGIIYVHVFWDHPAPGPRPWAYLVANELLVLMVVGLFAGAHAVVGEVGRPT